MNTFKKYLPILALLMLPVEAFSALLPPVNQVVMDGQTIVLNSNSVTLYCFSTGGNPNCTYREQGASAGYQVPGGKTLYVYGGQCRFSSNITTQALVVLYSNNDVGQNSSTAFTSQVDFHGQAWYFGPTADGQFISQFAFGSGLKVPATKYFGHSHTFSNFCIFYGEVK